LGLQMTLHLKPGGVGNTVAVVVDGTTGEQNAVLVEVEG
jgi:hypothetical protein